MINGKLERIKEDTKDCGCFSWTSREYQDDLISFLMDPETQGGGVVEVGCYRGGLSALIACVCKERNWPFYTMDIDKSSLESTARLLKELDLFDGAILHLGTLGTFAESIKLEKRPALIILDGDHRYEEVVSDINKIYCMEKLPYAAAFHDYSLRHPTSGENVSQAICDSFAGWPLRLIGKQMDGTDMQYPTQNAPSEDGHWWETPGSEGALLMLPEMLSVCQTGCADRKGAKESLLGKMRRLIGRLVS